MRARAERLARSRGLGRRLAEKRLRRARDQRRKPLEAYRAEEMARSHRCFFGPDRSYHEARRRFVYKLGSAAPSVPRRESRAA
jgi:putative two-component system protein, hydrogenase maturation factor HypX/HoxX